MSTSTVVEKKMSVLIPMLSQTAQKKNESIQISAAPPSYPHTKKSNVGWLINRAAFSVEDEIWRFVNANRK